MAFTTGKTNKRKIKQADLPKKNYKTRSSIHTFNKSKLPLTASIAQKAPQIFNLTA